MKVSAISKVQLNSALMAQKSATVPKDLVLGTKKEFIEDKNSSEALKNYFLASQNLKLPSFTGYPCSTGGFVVKQIDNVPCACCGKEMMNNKEQQEFVSKASKAKGQELSEVLSSNLHKFRRNEKAIARHLMNEAKKRPELTMSKLLATSDKNGHDLYIEECNIVLNNVDNKAKELYGKNNKVSHLVEEKKSELNDKNNKFDRENFLKDLQKTSPDKNKTTKLLDEAIELPLNEKELIGIFNKYKGASDSIGLAKRLISTAAMTTEHIHPKSQGGPNDTSNYMGECAECNNNRGHQDLNSYWEEFYPNMPENVQKYNDFITEEIVTGKMGTRYEDYPLDLEKAVETESKGKIDLKVKNPEEIDKMRKERGLDDPKPLNKTKKETQTEQTGSSQNSHKSGKSKKGKHKHVYTR